MPPPKQGRSSSALSTGFSQLSAGNLQPVELEPTPDRNPKVLRDPAGSPFLPGRYMNLIHLGELGSFGYPQGAFPEIGSNNGFNTPCRYLAGRLSLPARIVPKFSHVFTKNPPDRGFMLPLCFQNHHPRKPRNIRTRPPTQGGKGSITLKGAF
jgi:hypothetical protein